jgi:hypothetical protein
MNADRGFGAPAGARPARSDRAAQPVRRPQTAGTSDFDLKPVIGYKSHPFYSNRSAGKRRTLFF